MSKTQSTQPGLIKMLWQARGLVLGISAVAAACYAQLLIVAQGDTESATGWYALAILLMIVGFSGRSRSTTWLLRTPGFERSSTPYFGRASRAEPGWLKSSPDANPHRGEHLRSWRQWVRPLMVLAALAGNISSVGWLRSQGYSSCWGGIGWLASLVVLFLAFRESRPASHAKLRDAIESVWAHRFEIAVVLSILALALGLRLYRLGDWTTGVHGDEGEVGMEALKILEGQWASPFQTGWFSQSNFYYWAVALTMKGFGTGLFGLRIFAVLAGTAMLVPFYLLLRDWFGVRVAVVASLFLAMSDVAIHFSRQQFSNITTPLFLVSSLFFLSRGLRKQRLSSFVLCGYASMMAVYFYLGGRIVPLILVGVFVYLLLVLPALRLPGSYRTIRAEHPQLPFRSSLAQACRLQIGSVWSFRRPVLILAIAGFCLGSPWLSYYLDHRQEVEARVKDKIIFQHADRMAAQHQVTHEPLHLGLRAPRGDEAIPTPLVFERTRLSIKLAEDGFWYRALWRQLVATLSILTSRADASSVYTFTREPVAKPLEAVLIVLGIAWALWRLRDTRMAILSLWFWSTVLIGGALTIDAPYMARLVPIIPVLAIFAALTLENLAAQARIATLSCTRSKKIIRASGAVFTLIGLGLLLSLLWQNYDDYYNRYLALHPFRPTTGMAYFVRQTREKIVAQGRPAPEFHNLGPHVIYWTHGVNRFLNHGTPGFDSVNLSDELPLRGKGDRDVVFIVWPHSEQYLPILKFFYPNGIQSEFQYGPDDTASALFTAYRIRNEELQSRHVSKARYKLPGGRVLEHETPRLGALPPSLPGLLYPIEADWRAWLIAPAYGRYRFRMRGPEQTRLTIDQQLLMQADKGALAKVQAELARGPHRLELHGRLPDSKALVELEWAREGEPFEGIPPRFLWSGAEPGLVGEVRLSPNETLPLLPDRPDVFETQPLLGRRIDAFLGFRDTSSALSNGRPLIARWWGSLEIPQTGSYRFRIVSNGASAILIDSKLVVDNTAGKHSLQAAAGEIELQAGQRNLEVLYQSGRAFGQLEVYWQPPGRKETLLSPGIEPVKERHATSQISHSVDRPTVEILDSGEKLSERILGTSGLLKGARSLTVASDSKIYVADTPRHRIVVLDPETGHLLRTWGQEGEDPGQFQRVEDVAAGPRNSIYVLDSGLPSVQIFDLRGRLKKRIDGRGIWCQPAGFAVGPDASVYIADTCHDRIRKYDSSGQLLADYTGGNDPTVRLKQPVDLFISEDAIYVVDLRARIARLDPVTDRLDFIWSVPVGSALGGANMSLSGTQLYLSDPDRHVVYIADLKKEQIRILGGLGSQPGKFLEPVGVAASPTGEIFVLEAGSGRIQIFSD